MNGGNKNTTMNYRELSWSELRSFATSQGIDIKGKKKVEILEELDNILPQSKPFVALSKLEPFKGIKEEHPFFKEVEEYLPYLKAYKKLNAVSRVEGVTKAIATIFIKYIETDKRAKVNLKCGNCVNSYYRRLVHGYNKLAIEHGRECI